MKYSTASHGRFFRAFAIILIIALGTVGLSATSDAQDGIADEEPLTNQPRVLDGRIYGIDSDGSTVIVAGTFTTIKDANNALIAQASLFKFDVDTGLIDQNFLPVIDGEVDAVAISADGEHAYISGNFSDVNGTTRRRIAKLDLADGSVVTDFQANANLRMYDIALDDDKLFVAGKATSINGVAINSFAALDLVTGDVLAAFTVPVTGTRDIDAGTWIAEIDLAPNGDWIVLAGNFDSIDGQLRQQIGVIEIGATSAFVSDWETDRYGPVCGRRETYIRGVAIDPDSSYFVVSTTGWHRGLVLLCDSEARFDMPAVPTAGTNMQPQWVTYTGGDTHWASEVTDSAVYVGGHMRWENNIFPVRGNSASPGAVERPGIVALDPLTGIPLSWNPGRHRGRGVEAFHFNDDYLFVGSDTDFFNNMRVERLAILPFNNSTQNPPPIPVNLPASLHVVTEASVDQIPFDGTTFGAATTMSGPAIDGVNWCVTDAVFAVNNELIAFDEDNAYYRRSFDGALVGSALNLSATVGYVDEQDLTPFDQPYGVAETTNAAYHQGRIFYTKQASTELHWRFHGLESGIIGAQEFVASNTRDWSDTTGLTIMGGQLYAASTNNELTRYDLDHGLVSGGAVVDAGAAGIDWSSITDLFSAAPPTTTPLTGLAQDCGGTFPTPPTTTLTTPSDDPLFNDGVVNIAGDATDNTAVTSVEVTVRDTDSGLYLQPDGSFTTTATGLPGIVTAPGAATTDWTAQVTVPDGAYEVSARAIDDAGDADPFAPTATFTVDTTAPTSTLVVADATSLTGTAVDAVGVALVRVSILDVPTDLFLQADGSFAATRVWFEAEMDSPDATTTNWSLPVSLPDGQYRAILKADDTAGNVETGVRYPFTVETIVAGPLPTSAITSPTTLTAGPYTMTGTATDDIGVNQVQIVIRSLDDTTLYVQADGSLAAGWHGFAATLTDPGTTTTDWSMTIEMANPGLYRFSSKAFDTDLNVQSPAARVDATVN